MKCLEQIPFISTPCPEVQGTDDRLCQCPERACFISTLKMKLPNRPNKKLLQIKLPSRPSRKRVNALNGLIPFPLILILLFFGQVMMCQCPERACSISAKDCCGRNESSSKSVNALNGLVPFPLLQAPLN